MQLTLSTGEQVTLRDRFTHGMHKELFRAINKGVSWKMNTETGEYEKEVPAENIEFQYEAVLPLMIEKIEKEGKQVPLSPEWVQELLEADYMLLEAAAAQIKIGKVVEEDGKKKA
jgi:hypothetical protein